MEVKTWIGVVVLGVILTGCAGSQTRIVSKKDENFTRSISRMYVLSDVGTEFGMVLGNAFIQNFNKIMNSCGVAVMLKTRSHLELDDRAYLKDMEEFNADSLLSIIRAGGTVNQDLYMHMDYDVRLYDVSTKKYAYRAIVSFAREGQLWKSLEDQGKSLAIDVTNKLKDDRLLGACPRIEEVVKK